MLETMFVGGSRTTRMHGCVGLFRSSQKGESDTFSRLNFQNIHQSK